MFDLLKQLLDHLESTVDLDHQQRIHEHHRKTLHYETVDRLPVVFSYPPPADSPYEPLPYREGFDDPEKMLYNELVYAFSTSIANHSRLGDDLPYTIRANCGTGLIASVFGAKIELTDDNFPWVRPVKTDDVYATLLDIDPTDFTQGLVPKAVNIYQTYTDILNDYPNLKQAVTIVLPDMQGPFDTAELLVGSSIFTDFYEQPDMLNSLLAAVARAQVALTKHLQPMVTDNHTGYCRQHAMLHRGNILIRNDSAIMLSPQMYREQLAEHDGCVLKELNGGGFHFCGRGDHLIDEILALPALECIDLGQSFLNDMDLIYEKAAAKKIPLVRVRATPGQLLDPSFMNRWPTGIILHCPADSFLQAKQLNERYRS